MASCLVWWLTGLFSCVMSIAVTWPFAEMGRASTGMEVLSMLLKRYP